MENALIIGAGGAGRELLESLSSNSKSITVKGFLDDDKKGEYCGLPILGNVDSLPEIINQNDIRIVFIAIPSGNGALMRKIIQNCRDQPVKINIVPRISEIVNGVVNLEQVRQIQVEDLVGRSIYRQDFEPAKSKIRGKTVMVFGAAGSIGSELCSQLLSLNPKQLIAVDWWENGTFYLQDRLATVARNLEEPCTTKVKYVIANIQERARIGLIFQESKPDIIFNAAAYKHVPLMEHNPVEAVKNNVLGTKNLFELSLEHDCESFILISSDKAVNPTNVMGATKRVTEKLMHYYSQVAKEQSKRTKFMAVRFGNVLASNGSVIPTFRKQIQQGYVTITHKDIVRYFMTIDEAAQLVLQCWVMGTGDEVFVLDMGEPIKIEDLARWMIRLSGKEPDKDVEIRYVGLRPGEKLYEEPLTEVEHTDATKNNKIFIVTKDEDFDHADFIGHTKELIKKCTTGKLESSELVSMLKGIVPTFKDPSEVNKL
ncbi:polysaccharide biosynthesis protein [Candidatus Woesearchaeota archaeon]|nr:polysaccharide biosynthesis protein [Candidatus Woesearchaeota archaeon]